jgi:hypothetical protein
MAAEGATSFWLKAAAVVLVALGVVTLVAPEIGLPFLVTKILLLPLLLPFLFNARVIRWQESLGRWGRFAVFGAVFLYIALMESFLAPIVLAELGYRVAA